MSQEKKEKKMRLSLPEEELKKPSSASRPAAGQS